MPKFRVSSPPEFRRQMVELVRSGRTSEDLASEFEPTAQSIWKWVRQADERHPLLGRVCHLPPQGRRPGGPLP
jgi:transposase-like protein